MQAIFSVPMKVDDLLSKEGTELRIPVNGAVLRYEHSGKRVFAYVLADTDNQEVPIQVIGREVGQADDADFSHFMGYADDAHSPVLFLFWVGDEAQS